MQWLCPQLEKQYDESPLACFVFAEQSGENVLIYFNSKAAALGGPSHGSPREALPFLPSSAHERLADCLSRGHADSWCCYPSEEHVAWLITALPLSDTHMLLTLARSEEGFRRFSQQLEASEKGLKDALQQATVANKAKTQFLSSMSHDIRTPMNAIVGMTEIALNHLDQRDRVKDCLSKIKLASSHLLSILNKVLDMSSIESGKLTLHEAPFSLGELLHQVSIIIRSSATDKGLTFSLETGEITQETLVGDMTRIQQILINLLGNAVKFTPSPGRVMLRVHETIEPWNDQIHLVFEVEDTGMGMDEEFLKRIYLPFERAHNTATQRTEGTGLGMSITSHLVSLMHGSIEVTSHVGQGTLFKVNLPLEQAKQPSPANASMYVGKGILLWEKQGLCQHLDEYLASQGLFCACVENADELIAKAESLRAQNLLWGVIADGSPDDPSLLSDVRRIKKALGAALPFLIVSRDDWALHEYEAHQAGVDAFLPWPLYKNALSRELDRLSTDSDGIAPVLPEEPSADFSTQRILLVEDNELNMEIACEFLSATGVQIDTASNGQEAVSRFSESAPYTYRLILMDVQMPIMDGHEATRRIRALNRPDANSVGIVAMTANAFAEDARLARQCGMNDHLTKPLNSDKLYAVLHTFLDHPIQEGER